MKARLALGILLPALFACGSADRIEPAPTLPMRPDRCEKADEIVAFYNGEPLTWRAVAEKTLELNLKTSVDHYVRWRIVEDRKKALGIAHTPEELRRRAETLIRQTRQSFQGGEKAFEDELVRQGLSEDKYRDRLVGLKEFGEMLDREKIVRYSSFLEDTLEIDRMVFLDESDARTFAEHCRQRGFDPAAEEFGSPQQKGRVIRLPRETFPRSAPPTNYVLDPWIVDALLKMKPGQFTGAEASRSNLHYVIRLLGVRPGRKVPYAEVRAEVLESILRDPPRDEDFQRWISGELARSRIEYGTPGPPKERPR